MEVAYKIKHSLIPYFIDDAPKNQLGIYPIDLTTYDHTNNYIQVFTITLITIASNWNQPRYPA